MTAKRLLCFLLFLCILFSFLSCGDSEETTTVATEEKELSTEEKAAADEAALKKFVKEYREGVYAQEELFNYEDLSAYYSLGDYKSLTYPDDKLIQTEVSEEEVERYMTFLLISNTVSDSDYTEVPQGEALQEFDVVVVDSKGVSDGVEYENAEDASLMLGSRKQAEEYENGFIGQKVGSTFQMQIAFSTYFHNPNIAGKTLDFTVFVKSAMRPKIPEATPEVFSKIAGKTFSDLSEVRKDIRSYLENKRAEEVYQTLAEYLQGEMLNRGKVISYPEKEVEIYRRRYIEDYTQQAESGTTLEEFCQKELGISFEEFNQYAIEYAQISTEASMMVLLIAQKEGITCSDEQLEAVIWQLYTNMSQYFSDMESFLAYHRQMYGADYFEDWVINAAVSERLVEYAVKVS